MQIHVAPERRFAADFKPAGDAHRPLDVGGRLQNRGQLIARGQDFDGDEVRFALLADMTRRAEWVRQILFAAGEPAINSWTVAFAEEMTQLMRDGIAPPRRTSAGPDADQASALVGVGNKSGIRGWLL